MTGTMSQRNLATFTKLASLDFSPESTQWETSTDFKQRYLSMDLIISSKYTTHLNLVVSYLCDSANDAAFVFANSRALTFRVVTSLEEKIDKAEPMAIAVLHVHGALEKEEKHAFTNLFTGDLAIVGRDNRVTAATSAADLGIDHTECTVVLILEWPDSLASYVQRHGRADWRKQISKVIIVAGLALVISLVKRIHRQQDKPSDVMDESEQNNVVICNTHVATPKKSVQRRRWQTKWSSNYLQRINRSLSKISSRMLWKCGIFSISTKGANISV